MQRPELGPADMRMLAMLHQGLTNKEIAQRLGYAESTIKSRFNRLYRRFGVTSRVQLLGVAMRAGMIGDSAGAGRERLN